MEFEVKITSGARKHGPTRTRIEQALNSHRIAVSLPLAGSDPKIAYVGTDDRGVEIEIVAVVLPGMLLVIHAMPTHYRRSPR